MKINIIHNEDCLTGLSKLPDESVHCCVTSPPYYGLRDYGCAGQLGLEAKPEEYVAGFVAVFEHVRRVLKSDGTLWLNIGDSYANNRGSGNGSRIGEKQKTNSGANLGRLVVPVGYKQKDLIGVPWMIAFALRSAGWFLRQDIIWNKPNPMPESVTDRCTKAHEYIFLLSKSAKYYYDAASIKTELIEHSKNIYPFSDGSKRETMIGQRGIANVCKKGYKHRGNGDKKLTGHSGNCDSEGNLIGDGMANKKSVWTVATKPLKEAHFATFPEDLIVPCIKAGCPVDGIVLDPFMGAGTTALVARKLSRNFIGYELNADYIKIAETRLKKELGMFL